MFIISPYRILYIVQFSNMGHKTGATISIILISGLITLLSIITGLYYEDTYELYGNNALSIIIPIGIFILAALYIVYVIYRDCIKTEHYNHAEFQMTIYFTCMLGILPSIIPFFILCLEGCYSNPTQPLYLIIIIISHFSFFWTFLCILVVLCYNYDTSPPVTLIIREPLIITNINQQYGMQNDNPNHANQHGYHFGQQYAQQYGQNYEQNVGQYCKLPAAHIF